jgi:hypothetical protein
VRRPLRAGEFAYTEQSGLGGLLLGLGLLLSVEGLAAHFLVYAFCPRAAWVLAASNVYALVWLAAAYQAARLRPVSLTDERLVVRTSLLWTVDVPRELLAAVSLTDPGRRGRGVLRAAVGIAPAVWITLARPVTARGPFGVRRRVTTLALYVDEPMRLAAALASPRESGRSLHAVRHDVP